MQAALNWENPVFNSDMYYFTQQPPPVSTPSSEPALLELPAIVLEVVKKKCVTIVLLYAMIGCFAEKMNPNPNPDDDDDKAKVATTDKDDDKAKVATTYIAKTLEESEFCNDAWHEGLLFGFVPVLVCATETQIIFHIDVDDFPGLYFSDGKQNAIYCIQKNDNDTQLLIAGLGLYLFGFLVPRIFTVEKHTFTDEDLYYQYLAIFLKYYTDFICLEEIPRYVTEFPGEFISKIALTSPSKQTRNLEIQHIIDALSVDKNTQETWVSLARTNWEFVKVVKKQNLILLTLRS